MLGAGHDCTTNCGLAGLFSVENALLGASSPPQEPFSSGMIRGMFDERDRFAQADRHVSVLKERIIRQRAVLVRAQQKGHATEAAESLLRTLEESLRGFEKHRQVIFDRLEAKQRSLPSDGAPDATHPSSKM